MPSVVLSFSALLYLLYLKLADLIAKSKQQEAAVEAELEAARTAALSALSSERAAQDSERNRHDTAAGASMSQVDCENGKAGRSREFARPYCTHTERPGVRRAFSAHENSKADRHREFRRHITGIHT